MESISILTDNSSSESDSILRFVLVFLNAEWEPTDDIDDDLELDLERDLDLDLGRDVEFDCSLVWKPEPDSTDESDWERDELLRERDLDLDLRSVDSFVWLRLTSSVDDIASDEFISSKIN